MFGGIGGIQHLWFVADVLLSQWVGLRETPGLQLHGFLQGLDGFLARKNAQSNIWSVGDLEIGYHVEKHMNGFLHRFLWFPMKNNMLSMCFHGFPMFFSLIPTH
jgi:hypothetical protein